MLLFSPSLAGLLAGRGVLVPMGMTSNASSNVTVSLTVYSGTQSSAADIASNWVNYNSTYLFHVPGVVYKLSNPTSNTLCGLVTNANYPSSDTAVNTGTAAWCIVWCSNVASGTGSGQIGNATIPNSQFIVGPVTLYSGNGIVRLSDLSVTSGLSYTFLDSTIFFNKI